ncbi:MAG: maleylpyruvate isomerase family mycothiol-dependent enzyme [Marmoricola sp.]
MLSFDEYGDAIGNAWTVLREHANRAGPGAAVPTCPGWTVRDLVAHQGMIHRWAAANIRGISLDTEAVEAEGLQIVDQLEWFDLGARDLLQALVDSPEDLEAWFFLHDAPPPRLAWARRQCHETTIHAVDAMAASGGAAPPAASTWIRPSLAADGVDELLTGFLPRPRTKYRPAPVKLLVTATDTDHVWSVDLGPDAAVTIREPIDDPDATLTGTAAGLYLALWNRGNEVEATGEDVLTGWREQFQVRWS